MSLLCVLEHSTEIHVSVHSVDAAQSLLVRLVGEIHAAGVRTIPDGISVVKNDFVQLPVLTKHIATTKNRLRRRLVRQPDHVHQVSLDYANRLEILRLLGRRRAAWVFSFVFILASWVCGLFSPMMCIIHKNSLFLHFYATKIALTIWPATIWTGFVCIHKLF